GSQQLSDRRRRSVRPWFGRKTGRTSLPRRTFAIPGTGQQLSAGLWHFFGRYGSDRTEERFAQFPRRGVGIQSQRRLRRKLLLRETEQHSHAGAAPEHFWRQHRRSDFCSRNLSGKQEQDLLLLAGRMA